MSDNATIIMTLVAFPVAVIASHHFISRWIDRRVKQIREANESAKDALRILENRSWQTKSACRQNEHEEK